MTTEDDEFLKQYNSKPPAAGVLSEDDFERIMEVFEDTATEQTPFAAVDNTVAAYDMMLPGLTHINQSVSADVLQHAKPVYEYWKSRRQEAGNKPLHPSLKFETHQETDDTDPFVCFRRREARQTRKTRARDNKIAETLKKLRRELEDGRQLVLLAYEREMVKRELMSMDRAIFEERARLKDTKLRLGIKGEDEDLVNQKVCFRVFESIPLGTDAHHSLKNASLWNPPSCDNRPVLICGNLSGLMVERSMLISSCYRTSWPRRRLNCGLI